jgi:DNA-binding SARP family transcriptional activator/tetratricopeptide (TPR) repeat protein
MAGALQVRLLGQFRLTVDGRPVDGPATARLQSLFAYLLLHAETPQPRGHLSFNFWPEASESNARNNLRQLLHQLRQALPDSDRYLRADVNSVQWATDSSFSLDVSLFERAITEAEAAGRGGDPTRRRACLESAVDLCQGPLLPSCYDDWIGPVRERLARRCEEAVAALVGLLEEQREYASAVSRVRHWLQHDPLDEEAYRWLMRLLALVGDRVAALQAYRQCADTLRRELGAEPSASTVHVYERIRSIEPRPAAPSEGREGTPAPPALVGRQAEWSTLREAWERAVRGRAGFALVTGEAGIGKSRLAEELLTRAERQGVFTAKTRSYAAEGRLSLAPVSEWLRSDALSPHLARLEDVWRVEVARILPELLTARPDLPRPAPMTEFGDRLRFFEGLARAVLAAPPPLLLLIDDLQWCDRETLEWLHFLSRFDPEARLLVLGTARSEELDAAHPLPALLRQLRSASPLAEIALAPLDAAETAALAAQVGNRAFDADAATRLYRETEGNPLFVVETVRAESAGEPPPGVPEEGIDGLPPRVHAVIAGRLAQLSAHARETAAAAAVIGRAFDLEVLVRLVGDEDAVAHALDELWRKRIVREKGPNAYDFTHDKLREVAYGETSAPKRRLLHRRAAEVLVAAHEKDLDPVSAQIAAHYESAGLFEEAIPHYSRAAVVAQGFYAHNEAIALVGRGLSLLHRLPASARRDGWELQLQLVLVPSYRVTMGIRSWATLLDRALALCDRVGTDAQRAEILYGMQQRYTVEGRLEKSALITDEMVRLFRETQGGEPPRSAFAMLAGARLQMGRFQEACDDIDGLVREADPGQLQRLQESQGLNYEVIARAWQSHALWCLGRPDTAFERASHALRLARQLGQPFSQAIAATYMALLQQLRADPATFRRQAEEALALATEFEATGYFRAWAAILVAYAETLDNPEAAGRASLRSAILGFEETGARLRLPYYLALLADAHLRADDPDAGLVVVEEALSHGRETNERWWDAELHRLRAELLLAGGAESAEAEAALRRALEVARGQQAKSLELRAARALAGLWAGSGRTAEARDLLAPVYSWFAEGFDTPDLKGARALLSNLG